MTGAGDGERTYRVRHRTDYQYAGEVRESYGRAHLLPRSAPGQAVLGATLVIEPDADDLTNHTDYFGNTSTYYAVRTPHRELAVTATSEVHVQRAPAAVSDLDTNPWDAADGALDAALREYVLASPLVRLDAAVGAYAATTFRPGRGLGTTLTELLARIHSDFEYVSGATTVRTTLGELLHHRKGVCQDFAHLAVACLRSVGLPARYVSGYLETRPPPGRPKLQGADASHAWAAVHVPARGWLDLDPTNNQLVDARYVVTAWGRDYGDVAPLKGIILSKGAGSQMKVAVDVTRID